MWAIMNGMTDGIRSRMMPRRRSGIGTMTAMLIGASVGIAAWEALRRNQVVERVSSSNASGFAEDVLKQLSD